MNSSFVLFSLLKIGCVLLPLMSMVAYAILVERKLSAMIQDRIGPNRVGPAGIWQPVADEIKAIRKEDLTPQHVRKIYAGLAAAITMIPALLTVAIIPFGPPLGAQQLVTAALIV